MLESNVLNFDPCLLELYGMMEEVEFVLSLMQLLTILAQFVISALDGRQ